MKENYLIEYGKVCKLLEKDGKDYWVEIKKENEIIKKKINYKPITDKWIYDNKLAKNKIGKYGILKKDTVWERNGGLQRVYKFCEVSCFSESFVKEKEIEGEYKIIKKNPFLDKKEVQKLIDKRDEEKEILISDKLKLNKQIEKINKKMRDIDAKYDIKNRCFHNWLHIDDEEINDGKTTIKIYECEACGEIDKRYWHILC